ncbi:sensor histidine kinase [Streptomyces sp. NPDC050161]|uniref:sensor histidine kinase n=1 Tax=Streptomyces sp. NPDC050161 TaxID=3365604 RepID=UPI00379A2A79
MWGKSAWARRGVEALGAAAVQVVTARYAYPYADQGLPRWAAVVIGASGVLAVVLRRRMPPGWCAVGLAAAMGVLPALAPLTALLVYEAAGRLTGGRCWWVLGGAALVPVVVTVAWMQRPGYVVWPFGWGFSAGFGLVLSLVAVMGPALVGTITGQQRRLLDAARQRVRMAERARQADAQAARLAERSRMAAEMHDLLGHRLSLINLHTGGLEMELAADAPQLREEAVQIRSLTRQALGDLRDTLGMLEPASAGEQAPTPATGTRAGLGELVEQSRTAGETVALVWQGPDLREADTRVRWAVHRVVREALTNAHRHAPGAAIQMTVEHDAGVVRLRVHNEPARALPASAGTGRGLAQLRERARLLGGTLTAAAEPDGGFTVTAVFPARPDTPAADEPAPATTAATPVRAAAPGRGVLHRVQRGAAGLLGVLAVVTTLPFGLGLVHRAQPLPQAVNADDVHLGMSVAEVERAVGADDEALRALAAGRAVPAPPGTSCLFPYGGRRTVGRELEVTRYCFREGRLADVSRFRAPLDRS